MAGFDFDERVRIQVTWSQTDGTLVDPTTTTLRVQDPAAAVTVTTGAGLTNPSTGVYYLDVDTDPAGLWEYRWEADSPKGVAEGFFVVNASRIDVLNP